jgi:uncharacterized protein (DUF1330 family)
MTVYALVELEVTDRDAMGPYIVAVADTLGRYGGRFLVRAGKTEVVEGGLGQYPIKVIVEFPSRDAATAWYASPEYQAILPCRLANSRGNFLWVEGV